ncbi:flagellar assembly protein FliH [Spirochaetota bacterium]|nr:flagellar assembly protein FliH [Spirochaetota bacterium]
MKTYIIPSKKVVLTKETEAISTFTEEDNTSYQAATADPTTTKPTSKNFKAASELSRETKLRQTQTLIATAVKELATLKTNIANLNKEHQTKLEQQQSQLEHFKTEQQNIAAKTLAETAEKQKSILAEAETQAQTIIQEATQKGENLLTEARKNQTQLENQAHTQGEKKGFEAGLTEGRKESERLQHLTKKVLTESIRERSRLIERSEVYLLDLCIVLVKKIVKNLTDDNRNLIIHTIKEALKRADGWVHIKIHVNTLDLDLSEKHKADFYALYESIKNITILEDPAIEPGGCLIESDIGAIDARISSQLQELELAIRDFTPIKPRIE